MNNIMLFIIIIIILCLSLINNNNEINNKINNNNVYITPPLICIKSSNIGGKYGRGVYSMKNIKKGDTIEIAPYIEDNTNNYNGIIKDYIFNKSKKNNISVVGFGYVSMYNHSDNPNSSWSVDDNYVVVKAIKDIKKDEEITFSYGSNYWKSRKLEKL